ncbi:MAG: hypothetical protein A3F11_06670 [Gammaproteobacteria bacterium RIFCSPHIGHO2_12_FULL_37_14]|nr:MAG: hypothetical protein A3F11_06670 [Gammaproteobacteria bacterium RIFCSPHIGHO2_12_FULL_37_14]
MTLELLSKISDAVGLIGVTLMLIAYFMINTHRMSVKQLSYQLLNLIGAALVLFSLYYNWNMSAVVIETVWMLISMIGIYKILSVSKQEQTNGK